MRSSGLLAFALLLALHPVSPSPAEEKAPTPPDPLEQLERAILYHPRKYDPALIKSFESTGGLRLDFKTEQGSQTAWLLKQTKGDKPERLWVFTGGNATLALELTRLARTLRFDGDAFLLVDYPGFGECAGLASPATIRENMKESINAACTKLSLDAKDLPKTARVFGHSLGCAAALLAVEEFHLQAAVLCAPFTSTLEMAQAKLGVPKDFPLKHKFDNRAGLKELASNKGAAWLFHGDLDEVIPVKMSQTLESEFKDTVKLKIVKGSKHNEVIGKAGKDFIEAMTEARKERK